MKCLLLSLAFLCSMNAAVRLPSVLADHMVVQRGLPVHVWGMTSPQEAVNVSFRGNSRSAIADDIGRWSVYLPPGEAGGPFDLKINDTTVRDVLVGDVWVASGQSNMEWTLNKADNAQAEVATAKYPRMRLYHIKNKSTVYRQDDAAADPWVECSPESAGGFSAVAYFFGRELLLKNNVPIGLISTSWGGTPAEAWTSMETLGSDASLMPVFADWAAMTRDQAGIDLRRAGKKTWSANLEYSWMPSGLFNAMIAPITPFAIKGAIWYQGESNAGALSTSNHRPLIYDKLFSAMITDWRRQWGIGDFPFLFVQLANYNRSPKEMWPEVREAQTKALRLNNTGMAVTIDIGNPTDIHPTNKQDVGKRLALAARAIGHGEKIEYSGPLYRLARVEGPAMRVWFDHAEGLKMKGSTLEGFEIAGTDGLYQPATAKIDGTTVVVSSDKISAPVSVRYGWAGNPVCNLYNSAGLPASPFRSAE